MSGMCGIHQDVCPLDCHVTHGRCRAQLDALRFAAEGFCAVVADALRAAEDKGKGGQQVPFHGDFASAPPSTLSRLRWWADRLKEPGKDYDYYHKIYTEAVTERDELRDEVKRLTELRQHGCDCSDDDTCLFARQRDATRAELAALMDCYKQMEQGLLETHRLLDEEREGTLVLNRELAAVTKERDDLRASHISPMRVSGALVDCGDVPLPGDSRLDEAVAMVVRQRDVTRDALQVAREALEKIAYPHLTCPEKPGTYGLGVEDGHRCSAAKARAALERIKDE